MLTRQQAISLMDALVEDGHPCTLNVDPHGSAPSYTIAVDLNRLTSHELAALHRQVEHVSDEAHAIVDGGYLRIR